MTYVAGSAKSTVDCIRDVKETLAYETETRPTHSVFGPRRDRDQDLPAIPGNGWNQLPSVKGARPQFSAHVYSDQTARWMKMPLGTEGDLSPDHIMLDGDPAPTCERGTAAHGRSSQLLLSSLGLQTVAETLC